MSKQILLGKEARHAILRGMNVVASVVGPTLGPKGRYCVIDEHPLQAPLATKDGYSSARALTHLDDAYENMGCQLIKSVAAATVEAAGDGTTSSVILTRAIYADGLAKLDAGANPVALKRGIDKAVEVVVQRLKKMAIPADDSETIARVGTISANGDREIGELIAQAMEKVGADGVITMGESNDKDTTLTVAEGMQFDRGWALNIFLTDVQRLTADLEMPYILITERRFQAPDGNLVNTLEEISNRKRSLVIIAEDFEAQGLVMLANNIANGALRSLGIRAPGFGEERHELLLDLATVTGGYAFTTNCGRKLESCTLDDLGQAERVIAGRDSTTITGGFGEKAKIQSRIELLRTLAETEEHDFKKAKLKQRLARLSSGIAVIKVGGQSETEMREKKARVEDAIHATRAAQQEGIIPGGGTALLHCQDDVEALIDTLHVDEKEGAKLIYKVLSTPLRTICENAGVSPERVLQDVINHELGWGYNAATDTYEDLVAAGIIDPVKVTRVALQNASSIAAMALTTESMIAEKPAVK